MSETQEESQKPTEEKPSELPFTILVEGRFSDGNVRINLAPNQLALPQRAQSLVESEWEKARRENPHFFNGELFAFQELNLVDGQLNITAVPTDFKTYISARRIREKHGLETRVPVLCVSGLILTSDNKVLLGQRGSKVIEPNILINAPGGFIDSADRIDNSKVDPFLTFKRELREETGIDLEELTEYYCIGVTRDNEIDYEEIIIMAKTKLTAAEVLNRRTDQEVALISVSNEPKKLADAVLKYSFVAGSTSLAIIYLFLKQGRGVTWAEYFLNRVFKRMRVYDVLTAKKQKILKDRKIKSLTTRQGLNEN